MPNGKNCSSEKDSRRERGQDSQARASTTDPEARKMKMADGGYRPAYNVQFATAAGSRIIVGVNVTNEGADSGQMEPMLTQLERELWEASRRIPGRWRI